MAVSKGGSLRRPHARRRLIASHTINGASSLDWHGILLPDEGNNGGTPDLNWGSWPELFSFRFGDFGTSDPADGYIQMPIGTMRNTPVLVQAGIIFNEASTDATLIGTDMRFRVACDTSEVASGQWPYYTILPEDWSYPGASRYRICAMLLLEESSKISLEIQAPSHTDPAKDLVIQDAFLDVVIL